MLGIVSSNTESNIVSILEKSGLRSAFPIIVSKVRFTGKRAALNATKRKVASKLGIKVGDSFPEFIYVGDEDRDIEAAKACGMKTAAVSWGLHDVSTVLQKTAPDLIIDKPQAMFQQVIGVCHKK
jgi:phosphoglycolate phosphatase